MLQEKQRQEQVQRSLVIDIEQPIAFSERRRDRKGKKQHLATDGLQITQVRNGKSNSKNKLLQNRGGELQVRTGTLRAQGSYPSCRKQMRGR